MISVIPTTDHDCGPPPLYGPPVGVLIPVLIGGWRWTMVPPGDPVVDHLAALDAEGSSHDPG
jgi:hypothetical protein